MGTKWWAIALVLLCTLVTTSAQIFLKTGADALPKFSFFLDLIKGINIFQLLFIFLTNWQLLVGISLYAIGAVILILAFKGGEVTVIYPIFASSYIWVSLLSVYFFSEPLGLLKLAGIFIVISGITFIALGSKNKSAIIYTEVP